MRNLSVRKRRFAARVGFRIKFVPTHSSDRPWQKYEPCHSGATSETVYVLLGAPVLRCRGVMWFAAAMITLATLVIYGLASTPVRSEP